MVVPIRLYQTVRLILDARSGGPSSRFPIHPLGVRYDWLSVSVASEKSCTLSLA